MSYKTPYDRIHRTSGTHYTRIGSGNIPVEVRVKYDPNEECYVVTEVLSEGVDIKEYMEWSTLAELADEWAEGQMED